MIAMSMLRSLPITHFVFPGVCLCVLTMATGCIPLTGPIAHVPWKRHTIDDSSRGADGVRLADVNGDGRMDIATGWEEGGRVRVCLHPDARAVKRTWPSVTVGHVGSPEDAVFVDVDDDGAVDVVSACEGGGRTVWVHWAPEDAFDYLNPDAWRTEALADTRDTRLWMFCLPMQVDGQRGVDLIVGAKGDNAQIGWFESPADPRDLTGWTWHPIRAARWIMSLVAVDMDDDGDLDVVASDRRGEGRGCLWLENPGLGFLQRLPWPEHHIGGADKEVMFLTVVDLDRDGLLDVLAATRGHELLYLRRQAAVPNVWESHTIEIPEQAGTGKGVAVGDIDRDGRLDIVFTCEHAKDKPGVMWLSYVDSVTDPVWTAHDISGPEGVKFDRVELLDVDDDGDLDVLTCEEIANFGVIWYENPTIGRRLW